MSKMTKQARVIFAGLVVAALAAAAPAMAAGEGVEIAKKKWSFSGLRGQFDNNQLQRGFQVYKEVCASCHGLKRIAFRNLMEKGGPEFPEAGVRSLAATYKIDEIDSSGKTVQRAGRLSDRFPSPYRNEEEARSIHNGAYPPDLSLIAKGRGVEYTGPIWYHPFSMLRDIATGYQEGGADYIYALLTSYHENPPAYRADASGKLVLVPESSVKSGDKTIQRCVAVTHEQGRPDVCVPMADGMNYNTAFPGHQIAMAKPISDDQVKYGDGTATTVSNYAQDVAAFLSWTADPHHDRRKDLAWQVLLYLVITAGLLYVAKKRLWREVH